jgi:prevent-host-death family protein
MLTLTAKEGKYGLGRRIDLARAEPVVMAKHGRPIVVMMSVETSERLTAFEASSPDRPMPRTPSGGTSKP